MKGNGKTYTANFAQTVDDADGNPIRLELGQTFTGIDDGTAAFLTASGSISLGSSSALGTEETSHAIEATPVEDMDRAALIAELTRGAPDDMLRDGVEAKRRHEAQLAADDAEANSRSGKGTADTFGDLPEEERAEALKLMRSSEAKLRELAGTEKVADVKADHDKAEIVRAILADRRAKAAAGSGEEGEALDEEAAAAFVARNLDEIADDDLSAFSADGRAAIRKAEDAREGGPRAGLIDRLDALDKPTSA